jgi:hypothetical protein
MRLGHSHSEQSDPSEESVSKAQPSEKGRVKVDCELGIWLPVPRAFPNGHDAESWSKLAARVWWERSGLAHQDNAVDVLAGIFRSMREIDMARIRSSQTWFYLRDPAAQPLSVYISAWKQQGDRDRRLRQLTGADDQKSVRKPKVAKTSTSHLGTGLRTAQYRALDDQGTLLCILSYAFRVEEYETDVDVFTAATDLRALTSAGDDLERFVQGITVHAKSAK